MGVEFRAFFEIRNLRLAPYFYPTLKRKDILACLEYAAYLAQEQVTPIEN
jgi:hypothetical protein